MHKSGTIRLGFHAETRHLQFPYEERIVNRDTMLVLNDICWGVPDKPVLRHVSLTVPDRKCVVVTGPNGGGKTSLAKLIAGIEQPDSGKILLDGRLINKLSVTERARSGIAYAFQQPVRFKGLTVRDLMELAAGQQMDEDALCETLSKVGLCAREYIDREVSAGLSGGESKRIEIATVLARRARLSVFDEPEAGIDLWSFQKLIDVFRDLLQETDGSLLIISHQRRILEIADEIVVIANGQVSAQGSRDEILPLLAAGVEKSCGCPLEGAHPYE